MEQPKPLFEQYIETIEAKQARINANGMWKWVQLCLKRDGLSLESLAEDQIISILQENGSPSFTTSRSRIAILKSFYEFCVGRGVRNDNPALNISYKDLDYTESFRTFYWPNYLAMLNTLNRVWTPDEGLPIYPILVFAWIGIPLAAVNTLPKQNVMISDGIVDYDGQEFRLTAAMSDVLQRYAKFTSSRRDNRMTMIRTYQSDAFLYRLDIQNRTASDVSTEPINISTVLSAASDVLKNKHLCSQLKYNNIVKSGCLHRMYMMECEGFSQQEILKYGKQFLKPPAGYPGDEVLSYEVYKKAFGLK